MKQFWESAKKIEKNVKKQYMLDMYNMPKIETMDDVFRSFEYTRKAGNGITLKTDIQRQNIRISSKYYNCLEKEQTAFKC
jgi:hypothetical protein